MLSDRLPYCDESVENGDTRSGDGTVAVRSALTTAAVPGSRLALPYGAGMEHYRIRDLRNLAATHAISLHGCVEKHEIVDALQSALPDHVISGWLRDLGRGEAATAPAGSVRNSRGVVTPFAPAPVGSVPNGRAPPVGSVPNERALSQSREDQGQLITRQLTEHIEAT